MIDNMKHGTEIALKIIATLIVLIAFYGVFRLAVAAMGSDYLMMRMGVTLMTAIGVGTLIGGLLILITMWTSD